jgi:hypothetical protein
MPSRWGLADVDAKQSGTILVRYQFAMAVKLLAGLLSENCLWFTGCRSEGMSGCV